MANAPKQYDKFGTVEDVSWATDSSVQLKTYVRLMTEIKSRINDMESFINNESNSNLDGVLVAEILQLNIRIISEIVAISCLVAHRDIIGNEIGSFKKLYSTKDIIQKLSNLKAHFYPRPFDFESAIADELNEGFRYKLRPIEDGYITKEKLIEIWGKSGDFMHWGNLKKAESVFESDKNRAKDTISNIDNSITILVGIYRLLGNHQIFTNEDCKVIICSLGDKESEVSAYKLRFLD